MTQTIQSHSCISVSEAADAAGNAQASDAPKTEDNRTLYLSVLDSLNKLYETLNNLNSAVEKKSMEKTLFHNNKGEAK
ncbi:MAG: hypothetical protein LBU85_11060 [Treponema sp.]|jgi:hypothetical protein|nr:hypothetical protein [Treponema sp.]